MSTNTPFIQLLDRIRDGDESASEQFVREYEPYVRRAIRLRMRDRRMRQFLDSIDISQSVMSKFFVAYRDGKLQVATDSQLIGLLVRMAQNRLIDWTRHFRAECYVNRQADFSNGIDVEGSEDRPIDRLIESEEQEIITRVRARLTESQQKTFDRRCESVTWEEIGLEQGASPEKLRSDLRRGLRQVAFELGIVEDQGTSQ